MSSVSCLKREALANSPAAVERRGSATYATPTAPSLLLHPITRAGDRQRAASGKIDSIPAGTLFVNYLALPQDGGGVIKHAHLPGFVYGVQGTIEMDVDGAAPAMIQPGRAAFIGAGVMHSHVNPGTAGNDWWFIALRPAASRPLPAVVPGQKEIYTTADLTQLVSGAYVETLTESRLPANGIDRQNGPSLRVLVVIEGNVAVTGDAAMTGTASQGQGLYSLPGRVTSGSQSSPQARSSLSRSSRDLVPAGSFLQPTHSLSSRCLPFSSRSIRCGRRVRGLATRDPLRYSHAGPYARGQLRDRLSLSRAWPHDALHRITYANGVFDWFPFAGIEYVLHLGVVPVGLVVAAYAIRREGSSA